MKSNTATKLIISVCVFVLILCCAYGGLYIWRFTKREMAQNKARVTLDLIKNAEAEFKSKNRRFGTLPELAKEGFITQELAQGISENYKYSVTITDGGYLGVAEPISHEELRLQTYTVEYP